MSFIFGSVVVTSCQTQKSEGGSMLKMKPGRYRMRNGRTATVENCGGTLAHPWRGRDEYGIYHSWTNDGFWFSCVDRLPFDLVEYLGPEQAV